MATIYRLVKGTALTAQEHDANLVDIHDKLADPLIVKTNVIQQFTKAQRGAITVDNTGVFDLNLTNNFKCTPAGSILLTFTDLVSGQSGNIIFVNNANYSVTKDTMVKSGSNFLTDISKTGIYILYYLCDGLNVYISNSEILS